MRYIFLWETVFPCSNIFAVSLCMWHCLFCIGQIRCYRGKVLKNHQILCYIYKIHMIFNMARSWKPFRGQLGQGSMLTLQELVINHYGWTRGMLKYPPKCFWNGYMGKKLRFLPKKKFRLLGKNENCSKSVKNGSPRAGMHRFVTQI